MFSSNTGDTSSPFRANLAGLAGVASFRFSQPDRRFFDFFGAPEVVITGAGFVAVAVVVSRATCEA